ncbi:MAG: glycogen synthase GlgA [Pseudomonadota bacterium]|nr:glycogen synthase GlgA [Burkholderiales bacterium]MDQ3196321.1 glycogen synthase GlgA [Pseudomonadota bacterium]
MAKSASSKPADRQIAPSRTRVLYVTSEVAPLIKTGGLADVSCALPAALREAGVDVRVLVPGYDSVLTRLRYKRRLAAIVLPHFPPATLLSAKLPSDIPLLLIACPPLFQRSGGPYQDEQGADWPDNALRFGFLSRVAALLAGEDSPLSWQPDIVHGNDWQCGLIPAYLRFTAASDSSPAVTAPRMLFTIHNLAFQGIFPPSTVPELGLPAASFAVDGLEFHGKLSFLKAGLFYADGITTVSPTYAAEIQTEALGFGMQGLLKSRAGALSGILNGIDDETWDPARDTLIARRYTMQTVEDKAANKLALQNRLGLAADVDIPLFGMVSRITHQKGFDLLLEIAAALAATPAQIAILGTGDADLQESLGDLARLHPGRIAVSHEFDEALAHLIEAGADMFLMPSRFEPSGLNQMYSQRYGTPPVVRATGGLADSVVDYDGAKASDRDNPAGLSTGFVFVDATAAAFLAAVMRAIAAWRDKPLWRDIQRNGMARDFSWKAAAREYVDVYRALIGH